MEAMVEGIQERLVTFNLKRQTFGINLTDVQEIIKKIPITNVPKTPKFIKGVINLRGKIIPVLDLYQRLRMEPIEEVEDWRIIILEHADLVVGILVDSVSEVLSLGTEDIEKGNQLTMGLESKFIQGIGKHGENLIVILDLNHVLDAECNQETLSEKKVG